MRRLADWPNLFGHIISATGWTRREVEALTLHEANELLEYWSTHPPTHVLLAAFMKARPLRKSDGISSGDISSVVAAVGGTVASVPSREMAALLEQQQTALNTKVTKAEKGHE
jgi:hypothetical protein